MGWLDALQATLLGRRGPALDPDAFTEQMAERLRAAQPSADVAVTSRLALWVDGEVGGQFFLESVYRSAASASDDDQREVAIAAWLASVGNAEADAQCNADDIVPVMVYSGASGVYAERSGGTRPARRIEALNNELSIAYAVATPLKLMQVDERWFDQRGIATEGLRRCAINNLRAKLPGLDVQRSSALNVVIAGGYFEASVLLFDDFWAREAGRLRGDPVVAIPAHDVLLFGDSAKPKVLAEIRRQAREIHADAAYVLSPHLFRRLSDGRVVLFEE